MSSQLRARLWLPIDGALAPTSYPALREIFDTLTRPIASLGKDHREIYPLRDGTVVAAVLLTRTVTDDVDLVVAAASSQPLIVPPDLVRQLHDKGHVVVNTLSDARRDVDETIDAQMDKPYTKR